MFLPERKTFSLIAQCQAFFLVCYTWQWSWLWYLSCEDSSSILKLLHCKVYFPHKLAKHTNHGHCDVNLLNYLPYTRCLIEVNRQPKLLWYKRIKSLHPCVTKNISSVSKDRRLKLRGNYFFSLNYCSILSVITHFPINADNLSMNKEGTGSSWFYLNLGSS